MQQDSSVKNILIVFLVALIFYLLYALQSILVPLVLAMLIALMFQPLIAFMQRYKTPNWLLMPTITLLSFLILYAVYSILSDISADIYANQDYYIDRLNIRISNFNDWLFSLIGIRFIPQGELNYLASAMETVGFWKFAGNFANAIGSFTGSFFMFFLFYVILLSGMSDYRKFLVYVSGKEYSDDNKTIKNFELVHKSVISYIIIKFIVSLATGLGVFIICSAFDLNFAFFFGFMAFILNFIPSIGSIIATILPFMMAVIQFDSAEAMILLLISVGVLEGLIGNIIEPLVMGDRLRLNTVTVIFGLVFWGYMWGLAGMIMSVPLMVLIKLIFEQIPSFKIVARIMGSSST